MGKADAGLRNIFQTSLMRVHWSPIETGGTAMGVPDLEGCYNARQVWIEMKAADHWTVPKVRPQQVAWIERRIRVGGRVYIGVRRAGTELWLLRGEAARPLILGERLTAIASNLVLGRWDGGPSRWDWASIEKELFG